MDSVLKTLLGGKVLIKINNNNIFKKWTLFLRHC